MTGKEFLQTFLSRKILKLEFFACIMAFSVCCRNVQAQMFEDAEEPVATQPTPAKQPRIQAPAAASRILNNPNRNTNFQTRPIQPKTQPIQSNNSLEDTKEKPVILLYMSDFSVSRNLNGTPTCNMKFFVFSTVRQKITNLSYRLRWPQLETVVSFDNVAPNQATYLSYALGGEGCYNMDKTPNIVVNRCRIKGMSQQQCAAIISWAK